MTSWFLFTSLFVFLFMGIPISICLGLAGMLSLYFFSSESLASLSLKLFETSEHYTLMAIPFFILGGTIMSTGGVAKRLIRFAVACVGHIKGGLAIASVLACTFFAAVSGSSPATVVAVGTIMIATTTLLVGIQLTLNFFSFDMNSVPNRAISKFLVKRH